MTEIPDPRPWLCRHGFHMWRTSADGLREECSRCGEIGDEIEDWWI